MSSSQLVKEDGSGSASPYLTSTGTQAWKTAQAVIPNGNDIAALTVINPSGVIYQSGALSTLGKFAFLYGRVDIRAKMPRGQGLWPALWLATEKTDGHGNAWSEIDLLEQKGQQPSTIYQTLHWMGHDSSRQVQNVYVGPDFSLDYHTFSLLWTPTMVQWRIDGVAVYTVEDLSGVMIPHDPMYLIADLATGQFASDPDGSTPFPQTLAIASLVITPM